MRRHILQVYLYEVWRNLRRKGFLFTTFGVPILLFLLTTGYSLIQSNNASNASNPLSGLPINVPMFDFESIKKAGIVDLSGKFTDIPEDLRSILSRYPDEEAARTALNAKEIDVFYVIQPDYLETGAVVQHLPRFSLNLLNDTPMQALFYNTFAPNADAAVLQRLQDPLDKAQQVNLQKSNTEEQDGADYAILIAFSILFATAVFMTNGYLMQSIIEEKENRVIEILITTVRPTALLAGKILAFGTLGLFQMAAWITFAVIFSKLSRASALFSTLQFLTAVNIPFELLPVMLAYFILGYLLMAAIYGAIGGLANSAREGPQYAAIFTIISFVPYWAFSVFAEAPNSAIPVVMSLFPLTAPLAMLMRLLIAPVPPLEIALSLGILALSVVGMLWLAGRLFRMQTLLAGKMPGLRDLPAIIRG